MLLCRHMRRRHLGKPLLHAIKDGTRHRKPRYIVVALILSYEFA